MNKKKKYIYISKIRFTKFYLYTKFKIVLTSQHTYLNVNTFTK